jgi:hypothetical protein
MRAPHVLRSFHSSRVCSGCLSRARNGLLSAETRSLGWPLPSGDSKVRPRFCSNRMFRRQSSSTVPSPSVPEPEWVPQPNFPSLKTGVYGTHDRFASILCEEQGDPDEQHIRARIMRVSIQRNARGDYWNISLLQALARAVRDLALREDLRSVVISGKRKFSTGMVGRLLLR